MTQPESSRAGIATIAYVAFIGVGGVAAAAALSGLGAAFGGYAGLAYAVVLHTVTAYLIHQAPRHGVSRVLAAMGLLQGLGLYGTALNAVGGQGSWPDRVGDALGNVAWAGYVPMLAVLILVVPTGQPPGPRWRAVLVVQVVSLVCVTALGASFGLWPHEGIGATNVLAGAFGAVLFGTAIAAVASQVVRWRRADGPERAQLRVFALASTLVVAAYLYAGVGRSDLALWLATTALPIAVAYAVLRHRLHGLDPVVSRVLLWSVISVTLLALYLGATAVGTGLLRLEPGDTGARLLPAAVVAVLFAAVRQRTQQVVNRAMYGARGDPATAVRALAKRLAACSSPDDAPAAVAGAVAAALRLPWVAVQVDRDGDRVTAAHSGTAVADPEAAAHDSFTLEHAGETVGWLLAGWRRGENGLPAPDRRLLVDLAAQAAPAIATARLVGQLSESRDRLVALQQRDRERLRDELHDELSPTLTGITLGARTARRLLASDPAAAGDLLTRIADQASQSAAGVRRLLVDLRPAAVPGPDLATVLRERCEEIGRDAGIRVTLHAPVLPVLPERTGTAVYRIAVEALTNVARHANARTCSIEIAVGADLVMVVADDGDGLDGRGEGVGIRSMRERARHAGGCVVITSEPRGGTRVEARLPLASSS